MTACDASPGLPGPVFGEPVTCVAVRGGESLVLTSTLHNRGPQSVPYPYFEVYITTPAGGTALRPTFNFPSYWSCEDYSDAKGSDIGCTGSTLFEAGAAIVVITTINFPPDAAGRRAIYLHASALSPHTDESITDNNNYIAVSITPPPLRRRAIRR